MSLNPDPTVDNGAIFYSPTLGGMATTQSGKVVPLQQPTSQMTGTLNTGGTGGTGGTPTAALDTAAIANTQKSLDQLPGILSASLAAEQQKYQNAQHVFDAQEQQQRAQYDTGTTTNQQNYDSNFMAALRSGAMGLHGLLSILRGTGVEDWAKNAVRDTTNSDISTGLNTQKENQTSLDTSLSNFLTDLRGKRQENDTTFQNNQDAARLNQATQMQDLYEKMAKYYADAGDNANATKYLNMAGDQSASIAKYSVSPVGAYDTNRVAVQAAPISAFAGPTKQAVSYSPGDTGTAGVFTIGDARKRLAGVGA